MIVVPARWSSALAAARRGGDTRRDRGETAVDHRIPTHRDALVRLLVLGATGRTGRLPVDGAVERAHEVVACLRRPDDRPERPPPHRGRKGAGT